MRIQPSVRGNFPVSATSGFKSNALPPHSKPKTAIPAATTPPAATIGLFTPAAPDGVALAAVPVDEAPALPLKLAWLVIRELGDSEPVALAEALAEAETDTPVAVTELKALSAAEAIDSPAEATEPAIEVPWAIRLLG